MELYRLLLDSWLIDVDCWSSLCLCSHPPTNSWRWTISGWATDPSRIRCNLLVSCWVGVNRYTNDIGNRQPDQQVKVVDTNCLRSTHYCSEAQNLTHWHWWPRASPTDPVETSREIQKFKRQKWQCNSKCPLSICVSSKLRDCLSVCPSVRRPSVCLSMGSVRCPRWKKNMLSSWETHQTHAGPYISCYSLAMCCK